MKDFTEELERRLAEYRRRNRRQFVRSVLVPCLIIWSGCVAFLVWYYW